MRNLYSRAVSPKQGDNLRFYPAYLSAQQPNYFKRKANENGKSTEQSKQNL